MAAVIIKTFIQNLELVIGGFSFEKFIFIFGMVIFIIF